MNKRTVNKRTVSCSLENGSWVKRLSMIKELEGSSVLWLERLLIVAKYF